MWALTVRESTRRWPASVALGGCVSAYSTIREDSYIFSRLQSHNDCISLYSLNISRKK